jgi:DNA-binding winged helix-turn-helix (wHTH) protein/tetratricopeptide (TPR) repeat protein
MSLTSKRIYEFGEFRLQVSARLLERNGRPVPLGSKAFEVLTCLVVHAGRIVTKDKLLTTVWPESFVEEGNLSQQVFALRRALGEHAGFIVTVPGRGYQFTERVKEVADLSALPGVEGGSFVMQRTRERTHIVIEETSRQEAAIESADERGVFATDLSSRRTEVEGADAGNELEVARTEGGGTGNSIALDEGTQANWRDGHLALPPPRRARHIVLWIAGVVILLAVGGGIFATRYLRTPGDQRVVIAELDNRTQDPGLDVVLRNALEIDLDQSPYIDVMSEPEALSTLRLMDRKPETAFVPAVAREVCQRSNRQVLIAGSVATVGRNYLLTLEATDCDSGKIIAGTKAEVVNKDQLLAALDGASASLRKSLGESAASLERFQVPIAEATTSSLEALQQYSIGEYQLGRMGKEESDVLPFFERAVELDPQFAMAQAAIATGYYNLGEYAMAAPYYQRAFDLSGQVSEKERLYIRAHYYSDDKRDIRQGLRVYAMWAETYPRDWGPWIDMADEHSQLGQYSQAIAAAQHALKLDSSRGIIYGVLARDYMHEGRYADAKATADRAFALGKDTNMLHATLLEIALAQNDQPAVAREIAWSKGKDGEWDFLDLQALSSAQQGRYTVANNLFQAAYDSAMGEDLPEKANGILVGEAEAYREVGLEAAGAIQGKPLLPAAPIQVPGEDESAHDYANASARAEGYLRARQSAEAAREYRLILDEPGVDPVSPLLPLARLGLARAEAQEGRIQQSEADYEALFAEWQHADADLPILLTARKEYLGLTVAH